MLPKERISANTNTKGKQLFLNVIYFLDLNCVKIQTWFIQLLFPAVFLPEYCFLAVQESWNKIGFYARKTSKKKREREGDWLWSPQTVHSILHAVWMNCDTCFFFFLIQKAVIKLSLHSKHETKSNIFGVFQNNSLVLWSSLTKLYILFYVLLKKGVTKATRVR